MLNEQKFKCWVKEMNLSEIAKEIVDKIRTSPPARNVGGGKCNVWGKYPSVKMGMTIQFESHTVELQAIYFMEHDEDVLEYYDQPNQIKLSYINSKDRKVTFLSTPDFFVIRKDGAVWEEWKTEDELIAQSLKEPNRYYKDENGMWRCPPGEEYALQFGLRYLVKSSNVINKTLQRNLVFLEDYLLDSGYQISNEAREELLRIVSEYPGITVDNLSTKLTKANIDDLYHLIAIEELYFDISKYALADDRLAELYQDEDSYITYSNIIESTVEPLVSVNLTNIKVREELIWDGSNWKIMNIGDTTFMLMSEDKKTIEIPKDIFLTLLQNGKIRSSNCEHANMMASEAKRILSLADNEDLRVANYRYECIKRLLGREEVDEGNLRAPGRTRREWLRKYKQAEKIYSNGYLGLIPKHKERGNKMRKLPEETLKFMQDFIDKEYLNGKQKTRMVAYAQMLNECNDKNLLCPSYKTFCREIKKRLKVDIYRRRVSDRAANQYEEFCWEIDSNTPRHGDRAFEICHLDHTELDIELVHSRTGKNLGRPWLTILLDAHTRRILAIYLTFDPPSYRSNMAVLRECVRRFNRLPQTIIVDGGREFQSEYFETLLAMFKITKKTKPAAKPRFGSIIERLFGTAQDEFIHNLQGNTQIMKNVRQVTKSVNPKNTAVWTFEMLSEMLEKFCYEVYDSKEHSSLGQSPKEAFESDIQKYGKREYRFIPYDENFYITTLPAPIKEEVKVHPSRGVRINYINYWSPEMKDPDIENQKVLVRYDPFNIGIAYAYLNGSWVRCISQYYSAFQGKTEKWLKCVVEEIKQNHKKTQEKMIVNAKAIATFISEAEKVETILNQTYKDKESMKMNFKEVNELKDFAEIAMIDSDEDIEEDFDIENELEMEADFDVEDDFDMEKDFKVLRVIK